MSLFDKIFGSPEERKVRSIIEKAQSKTEQIYGPVGELGLKIVSATWHSYQSICNIFEFTAGEKPTEKQIMIFNEFLYFYMHFTNRSALAHGLTEEGLEKIQEYLGPMLSKSAIDTFFNHWPIDLKLRLLEEFYENLNNAEMEYSTCKELICKDEEYTERKSLLGRLSYNIANQAGVVPTAMVCLSVKQIGVQALEDIGFEKLFKDITSIIDRVNFDTLNALKNRPWE